MVDPSTRAVKWMWAQKSGARGILRRRQLPTLVIDADKSASLLINDPYGADPPAFQHSPPSRLSKRMCRAPPPDREEVSASSEEIDRSKNATLDRYRGGPTARFTRMRGLPSYFSHEQSLSIQYRGSEWVLRATGAIGLRQSLHQQSRTLVVSVEVDLEGVHFRKRQAILE